MKKPEIKELKRKYPELFDRAIAIEENAKEGIVSVKVFSSLTEYLQNHNPCDTYNQTSE